MGKTICLDCGKALENANGIICGWARQKIDESQPEGFVCDDCHGKIQKIAGEIYEWEFPEPSRSVDLERICIEIDNSTVILALIYMRKLQNKAPIVYDRLRIWAKENNRMNWYNWGVNDAEKG